MIGRLHHAAFDCADPAALAAFYSALLGWPVTYRSDDWVVVAAGRHQLRAGFPAGTRGIGPDLA